MPDKSWKREEREVAKAFGTSRALMKGTKEFDFQIRQLCRIWASNYALVRNFSTTDRIFFYQ
jgi:hypothetical protein